MAAHLPYSDCRDSGIDWLGVVPSHWFVTKIKYGYFVTLGKMLQKEKKSSEDELKFYLKAVNIQTSGVSVENVGKMWFSPSEKTSLRLEYGDVLISEGGDVGRAAIWKNELPECYIQNAINRVRPKTRCSSRYLFYWVNMLKSSDYIDILCNKATIAHFTAEKVENSPLFIPAFQEAEKIANFLDHETTKIDTLIEKQQQLIKLLKEKRQAVISHAVTKGLNPNAPMRDSGVEWLGEVPAHWELPKLIHITSRIGDGLHSTPNYQDGTGYYFVNGNNLVSGQIWIGITAKEVPEEEYQKHYIHLTESSVLLSINGTIGNVARYNGQKIILGKSAAYINCLDDLSPEYLMLYLQSSHASRYYDLEVTGTTIYNLSLNSIRQMKVCLPPMNEQIEIDRYCQRQREKYDSLISKASSAIRLIQERRTALISAAVTGKIDVRDWPPPSDESAKHPGDSLEELAS